MDILETLKGMLGLLIKPIAKLLAKGSIKLVLMTATKDDDKLLQELAKEIINGMEPIDSNLEGGE